MKPVMKWRTIGKRDDSYSELCFGASWSGYHEWIRQWQWNHPSSPQASTPLFRHPLLSCGILVVCTDVVQRHRTEAHVHSRTRALTKSDKGDGRSQSQLEAFARRWGSSSLLRPCCLGVKPSDRSTDIGSCPRNTACHPSGDARPHHNIACNA